MSVGDAHLSRFTDDAQGRGRGRGVQQVEQRADPQAAELLVARQRDVQGTAEFSRHRVGHDGQH